MKMPSKVSSKLEILFCCEVKQTASQTMFWVLKVLGKKKRKNEIGFKELMKVPLYCCKM